MTRTRKRIGERRRRVPAPDPARRRDIERNINDPLWFYADDEAADSREEQRRVAAQVADLQADNAVLRARVADLEAENEALRAANADHYEAGRRDRDRHVGHDMPSIIGR